MYSMSKAQPFTPSINHWKFPGEYKERITRKQLQYLLLNQPDPIINGYMRKWKHKHLGVGVYELSVSAKEEQ